MPANGWKRVGQSPQLHTHTGLGDTMFYFSVALPVGALLLAFMHIRERRGSVIAHRFAANRARRHSDTR